MVCRTGLLDWIVPVFYGGNPIGYFISGSICNSDESKKELEAQVNLFSTFYSVSPEDFEAACELVQVVQKDQVRFFCPPAF